MVMRLVFRLSKVLPLLALAAAAFWLLARHRRGPCPFSARWLLHLPLRGLAHPVRRTLRESHVRPGAIVLELGPGTGYFSLEAARIVGPKGRLVCIDLQPDMAMALRRRLSSSDARNADVVIGEAGALPLADQSVDCAFLVTVLGEIPDRPRALRELRRVLAPQGILSVTETLPDPDYQFMGSVRDLAGAAGFQVLEETRRFLGYTLNFARSNQ
ncbi:MAG: methyltransferase domain-containing protein [Dehalococcoidia bacterium]